MESEYLLDGFLERKREGIAALRRGEGARARRLLLEAAEMLFKLSERSSGDLRPARARSARELLDLARSLPGRGAVPGRAGGARAAEGAAGDEDGGGPGAGFRIRERPSIRFDDIAGLDAVKEQFRLRLIYPFQHPERAERFRIPRGGGILLYGPPGTGKTMLARAVAGEIDADFFTVKPSEILSKWVGEAEKNIEALFESARACAVSVVFIDEIDALAPRRSENRSSVMARVVPQILAEMEGFDTAERNPMLFLGATNEPWSLDPAILRPGRFDEKVLIGLPDFAAVRKILELNLRGRPLAEDVDIDILARRLDGFSGADIRGVCERVASGAFLRAVRADVDHPIAMEDLARAIESARPSVSRQDMERYTRFDETGEGGS